MARVISLVIEASTYVGSTALLDGERLLGERTVAMRGREREALMPAVAELLDECGVAPGLVGRVICGAGPGAFTSLRIAGGIAKGIALANAIALVPVSSLALLVASQRTLVPGLFLAVVDAMRGEQYAQPYLIASDLTVSEAGPLTLVPTAQVSDVATRLEAHAVGPGQPGASAVDPHARGAVSITKLIDATDPADLARWEPAYGRLAEAQVKWEAEHGRPLAAT
jgi:tRNA threonylcarbamoyladenosine biosynthesis protein TsaB